MKLTVEQLLGLVAREVENQAGSTMKGRVKKDLLALHRDLKKLGVDGNEVTLETEEQVKKSSKQASQTGTSKSDDAKGAESK